MTVNLHYSQILPRPCLFLCSQRIPRRSSVCMATVFFLGIRCEQRPCAQKARRAFGRTQGHPKGEGRWPKSIITAIHE